MGNYDLPSLVDTGAVGMGIMGFIWTGGDVLPEGARTGRETS